MNTNQSITTESIVAESIAAESNMNNVGSLFLKAVVTLLMTFQLAGCFVAGGDGGLVNSQTKAFSENNVVEENASPVNKSFNWTAPVAREDESPISMAEIAGYRIYYGTTQGLYLQSIDVNDAYSDRFALDLPEGVYYLVITTIDVDGRESEFSEEVVMNV